MNCPECKQPLSSAFEDCPHCGFSFKKSPWIIITKVYSPNDIVIESLLKSYGIPVKVSRREIAQMPVNIGPLAEVEIAVPECLVEEARDLLEDTINNSN